MNQIGIPMEVNQNEVIRQRTLGDAISLCANIAGLAPKEVMDAVRVDGKPLDKAQWSRWEAGTEGIIWSKLTALMDVCGNDAPLLWMCHARGWDLAAMRKKETELEAKLREAKERIAELENKSAIQMELMRELRGS